MDTSIFCFNINPCKKMVLVIDELVNPSKFVMNYK